MKKIHTGLLFIFLVFEAHAATINYTQDGHRFDLDLNMRAKGSLLSIDYHIARPKIPIENAEICAIWDVQTRKNIYGYTSKPESKRGERWVKCSSNPSGTFIFDTSNGLIEMKKGRKDNITVQMFVYQPETNSTYMIGDPWLQGFWNEVNSASEALKIMSAAEKEEAAESSFPDTDLTSLEGLAAEFLYKKEIIGGYPDGTFRGDNAVNRVEIVKFLLLAQGAEIDFDGQNNGRFKDVRDGEWYVPYVISAVGQNIIDGYPDGNYGPTKTVNRAEALKMITKTFSLLENSRHLYKDVSSDDWFASYAGTAQGYNLFPEDVDKNVLNPAAALTRRELAIALYQYLSR